VTVSEGRSRRGYAVIEQRASSPSRSMAEQIFCARLHATGLLDATGFGRRSGEQLGLLQRRLLQRRFGQHHVDAFVQIDKLRDVHVGGDAAQRISASRGWAGRAFDQYDHLAQVRCGRDIEVGIERHGDDVGWRFRPGPCDAGIPCKRAQRAGEPGLDRSPARNTNDICVRTATLQRPAAGKRRRATKTRPFRWAMGRTSAAHADPSATVGSRALKARRMLTTNLKLF
jgi:hypothetical protein